MNKSKSRRVIELRKEILDLIKDYMDHVGYKRHLDQEDDYDDLKNSIDGLLEDVIE